MSNSASTMGLPELRDSSSDASALLGGRLRPAAFVEGVARGGYGFIYVGCGCVGDLGDDLFGGGVVDGDPVVGGVLGEFAVDEEGCARSRGCGGHGN
jgi:hypothetical protein